MERMRSASNNNYEVGYRKPPKAGRFRKGQSGNPRGRKRSDENFLSIFKRLATKQVKVNIDGVSKTLSLAQAIITKNYQAALKQDQTAMSNMLRLAELAGEFQDWNDPKVVGRPLFMPEPCTIEEFDELLAKMGSRRVTIPSKQTGD